jgi:hypothetical protein
MLLHEMIPALVLFTLAIVIGFYGGMEPKRRVFAIVVLCVIGLGTCASTLALKLRSRIVVEGEAVIFQSGFYRKEIPIRSLELANATGDIGTSLRRRTNGISSGGVNAGWFRDAQGTEVFAMTSVADRVLIPTTGGPSVVMNRSEFEALQACLQKY